MREFYIGVGVDVGVDIVIGIDRQEGDGSPMVLFLWRTLMHSG